MPTSLAPRHSGRASRSSLSHKDKAGIFLQPLGGPPQLVNDALAEFTGHKDFLAPDTRMPLVARAGGGVYLTYCKGYPSCKQVRMWKALSGAGGQGEDRRKDRDDEREGQGLGRSWAGLLGPIPEGGTRGLRAKPSSSSDEGGR